MLSTFGVPLRRMTISNSSCSMWTIRIIPRSP
jgi:hypothetical protein